MKLQATQKNICRNFGIVLSIGYCSAQNLLNYQSAFAYSAGTYGWNCDFYQIGNICISTGYRPCGRSVDYHILDRYEKQAEKINHDYSLSYDLRRDAVNQLLQSFIKEVTCNQ